MTNGYFDSYTPLPRNTLARAEAVNAIIDAIIVGFDHLPSFAAVTEDRVTFCVDTGAANAYVITPTFPIASYIAGQKFSFVAVHANTMASSLNVSGIGVKTIKRYDGTDLKANDILAGQLLTAEYDGTNFQLISVAGSDLAAAIASAAAALVSQLAAAASAAAASTSESNSSTSASAAAASSVSAAASAAGVALSQSTFSPALAFGGGTAGMTFTTRAGRYIKIGKLVTVWVQVQFSNKGSDVGVATLTGLPFTSANVVTPLGAFGVVGNSLASSAAGQLSGLLVSNSIVANLYQFALGAITQLTNADFTNTSTIWASFSYEATT